MLVTAGWLLLLSRWTSLWGPVEPDWPSKDETGQSPSSLLFTVGAMKPPKRRPFRPVPERFGTGTLKPLEEFDGGSSSMGEWAGGWFVCVFVVTSE